MSLKDFILEVAEGLEKSGKPVVCKRRSSEKENQKRRRSNEIAPSNSVLLDRIDHLPVQTLRHRKISMEVHEM